MRFADLVREADLLKVKIPLGIGEAIKGNIYLAHLEKEVITIRDTRNIEAVEAWFSIDRPDKIIEQFMEKHGFVFDKEYWTNVRRLILARKSHYERADVALIGGIGKDESFKMFDSIIDAIDNHINTL